MIHFPFIADSEKLLAILEKVFESPWCKREVGKEYILKNGSGYPIIDTDKRDEWKDYK